MLVSTKPDTRGKENILQRSAQLTDFKWTPLCDVATHFNQKDACINTLLPAGVEITGMPYSRNEVNDKFVCENVSFETLLSAMDNPDSVLYCKNMYGHSNASSYYGIVCSGLVRYSLGIEQRYSVKRFGMIPGMRKIATRNSYGVEQIELCDILYAFGNGRNHVALITDIIKDDSGKIVEIEVSEAVAPSCKKERYRVDEFYKNYILFDLWRYDYRDFVPECKSGLSDMLFKWETSKELPNIAIDFGNKSNYFLGQETVISVFRNVNNKVQIYKNGCLFSEVTIYGKGKIAKIFDVGYYEVKLEDCDDSVEFCVNYPLISHEVVGEEIIVNANPGNTDSVISHLEFREKLSDKNSTLVNQLGNISSLTSEAVPYNYNCESSLSEVRILTDQEIKRNVIVARIPTDAGYFKVTFKNKYGLWTHQMIKI